MKEWEMIEFTYDCMRGKMIEFTYDCMRGKIRELQDDIDQGYLDDDEIEETLDEINEWNEAIKLVGKLRDEYFMWSLEE